MLEVTGSPCADACAHRDGRRTTAERARKLLSIAALGMGMALTPGVAQAAELRVDGADATADTGGCGTADNACNTIQEAIDRATAGDVIQVAAGAYAETPQVAKRLRLNGAQTGIDARDGRPGAAETTVKGITLLPGADNSTIDGFTSTSTMRVSAVNGQRLINNIVRTRNTIDVTLAGTGPVLRHNFFDNGANSDAEQPNEVNGVFTGTDGYGGIRSARITDNHFRGHESSALNFNSNSTDVVVSGNQFEDDATAIVAVDSTDVRIEDNVGSGFTGTALFFAKGMRRVSVADNTLTGDQGSGISFSSAFGGDPSAQVSVVGNTITSMAQGASATASAINVADGAYVGGLDVHYNRITGSVRGVRNVSRALVDARNNWWGCNSGPGTSGCASIVGDGQTGASPYLRLTLAAPAKVYAGSFDAPVRARLSVNSAGIDLGAIPFPSTPIVITSTLGTLDGLTARTVAGTAHSVFTSGETAGPASIGASLDAATVTGTTAVVAPPKGEKGDAGTPGSAGVAGGTGATGATGPKGSAGARGPAGPRGPQGDSGAVLGAREASLRLVTGRVKSIGSAGLLPVRVVCGRARGCRGRIVLRTRGGRKLGTARYMTSGKASLRVRVQLNDAARKLLRKRGSLRVVARSGQAVRRLTIKG